MTCYTMVIAASAVWIVLISNRNQREKQKSRAIVMSHVLCLMSLLWSFLVSLQGLSEGGDRLKKWDNLGNYHVSFHDILRHVSQTPLSHHSFGRIAPGSLAYTCLCKSQIQLEVTRTPPAVLTCATVCGHHTVACGIAYPEFQRMCIHCNNRARFHTWSRVR